MINPSKELAHKIVLITGGAGFIGSHLCDRLLRCGAKVICFDNLSTGNKYYVESQKNNPQFVFVQGDVNLFSDIEKVFLNRKVDYIFHYAAVVGVQRTINQPLAVLNDIEGIKNISKLSVEHGVKKIVYASSSEIYGGQEELPFHEEMSYYDTRHPYALVKATGENYFKSYCELSGVPVTSLRFFNVYGPRQESSHYGFVVGIFISQAIQDMSPTIFRDGAQTRDFTYIDDNIDATILALIEEKANGEILNIGTGIETSILELAGKIIKLSNKQLQPRLLRHVNLIEAQRRVADTRKMRELLSYKPKISLDHGLRLTYEWYLANPQLMMREEEMDYASFEEKVWVPKKK